MLSVTDDTFDQEVVQSELPVLVDAHADHRCAPCRAIAPHIAALAQEFADQLKVVKLNIDENPRAKGLLHVRGVPSFFLFVDGQMVGQEIGAVPKQKLVGLVRPFLGKTVSTAQPAVGSVDDEPLVRRRGA